jgi:L-lactate dehydrogenase complex protein LldG
MTREAVIRAIRRGLRRGELSEDAQAALRARLAGHSRRPIPARTALDRPALIELFVANVEKEYGTLARLPDLDAVPGAVAGYLAQQNLPPRLVMSPHPELTSIPWSGQPSLRIHAGRTRGDDPVSLQHGFAGIAETGTLMLPSGPTRPTTVNLLAETAMVLLRTSRVVGPYEDAWDLLRGELGEGTMPRNVMLVTGVSRSADIEQTLELGAHGPHRLHVLLIEDE